MAYRIEGLAPEAFRPLFARDGAALAALNGRRVIAGAAGGYPCRVSLEEAMPGEALILVNHVSQRAATPFHASHAIYVREAASVAAIYEDEVPPLLDRRTISLRGFDCEGMLASALLAPPGAADRGIRALLDDPQVATVHAHNAAYGCFLAAIGRY